METERVAGLRNPELIGLFVSDTGRYLQDVKEDEAYHPSQFYLIESSLSESQKGNFWLREGTCFNPGFR